jgi:hypothetical protein
MLLLATNCSNESTYLYDRILTTLEPLSYPNLYYRFLENSWKQSYRPK